MEKKMEATTAGLGLCTVFNARQAFVDMLRTGIQPDAAVDVLGLWGFSVTEQPLLVSQR